MGDRFAIERGSGGGGLPDLSPSPAGTYGYLRALTLNAKGLATEALAGDAPALLPYDPAAEAALVGAPDSPSGADYTLGVAFFALVGGVSCTGVRAYWAGGAAILRLSLYDAGGTRLRLKAVSVSGPGPVEATFDLPLDLDAGEVYRAAMWSITSATGAYNPNLPAGAAPSAPQRSASVCVFGFGSAAGDAAPVGADWTYLFAVSPTLTL